MVHPLMLTFASKEISCTNPCDLTCPVSVCYDRICHLGAEQSVVFPFLQLSHRPLCGPDWHDQCAHTQLKVASRLSQVTQRCDSFADSLLSRVHSQLEKIRLPRLNFYELCGSGMTPDYLDKQCSVNVFATDVRKLTFGWGPERSFP